MQVEREYTKEDKEVFEKFIRSFDPPEEYNQEKLQVYLEQEDVKEVHVFKANPRNMKLAGLRQQFPDATRKQLRKML